MGRIKGIMGNLKRIIGKLLTIQEQNNRQEKGIIYQGLAPTQCKYNAQNVQHIIVLSVALNQDDRHRQPWIPEKSHVYDTETVNHY